MPDNVCRYSNDRRDEADILKTHPTRCVFEGVCYLEIIVVFLSFQSICKVALQRQRRVPAHVMYAQSTESREDEYLESMKKEYITQHD